MKQNSKKYIPYIWLDDETGHPIMMNERCTIIFSETLSTLRLSLYKIIGEGSEMLLRLIGRDMGKKYAQLVLKQYPELSEVSEQTRIYELCSIILRNTGFGQIEILELDTELPSMRAIIRDAPSGLGVKSLPPVYNLEAGMLCGILEEIFNMEMFVAEYRFNESEENYELTITKVE